MCNRHYAARPITPSSRRHGWQAEPLHARGGVDLRVVHLPRWGRADHRLRKVHQDGWAAGDQGRNARGELQKGHRAQDCEEPDGRDCCSRAVAGPWRLARTPFAREGTSTMPPHALSRRRSHAAQSHAARSHHTQRAHTQRTTFPGGDEHEWRGRLGDQGGEGAQGEGL